MYRFDSDYVEGCHPSLLKRLVETNEEQHIGYGRDKYCRAAAEKIRNTLRRPDAHVHFLIGGTQTNTTLIAHCLRPWESPICCQSGHINAHETGAVESRGIKIYALPAHDGKLKAEELRAFLAKKRGQEAPEHETDPRLVYLSQPTETGSLYSKQELESIREICDQYDLNLMVDGARLGFALASPANDVPWEDLGRLCDLLYIGGTKMGALFGEAAVIFREDLNRNFRFSVKQNGGMLAKGRLLGLQFDTLFTDNLYEKIGEHGDRLALKLRKAAEDLGYGFASSSPTNQQFLLLRKEEMDLLEQDFAFEASPYDEKYYSVRFCTSFATKEEAVDQLIHALKTLRN